MKWDEWNANEGKPKNVTKKRRHDEDSFQIKCVKWFDLQYPKFSNLLHHSANGGKRNEIEGARFKRMGLRSGYPDLIIYMPKGGYTGFAIELKSATGYQSPVQKEIQKELESQGYKYMVIKDDLDKFIDEVTTYMTSGTTSLLYHHPNNS